MTDRCATATPCGAVDEEPGDSNEALKARKGMLDASLITQEEYEAKKTQIVSRMQAFGSVFFVWVLSSVVVAFSGPILVYSSQRREFERAEQHAMVWLDRLLVYLANQTLPVLVSLKRSPVGLGLLLIRVLE